MLCFSAGIGRTGCFIATSIGMRQLHDEHMVDILGIVCSMRLDRSVTPQNFRIPLFVTFMVHVSNQTHAWELKQCIMAAFCA